MAENRSASEGVSGRPRLLPMVLALALLGSGCYTYTEVGSPAAVPPGTSVRLRVDPGLELSVGEVPLPGTGRVIRGMLLQGSTADTLLCSVPLSNGDPLTPLRGLRGTVSVPTIAVERLEVRRLARGRTAALLVTGAVLGVAVLDWAFDITNPNTERGDEPGGVNNARPVWFQLHW